MILVDSTPLVALCDDRDGLHERAWTDLARLRQRGEAFAVCEPVITETCYHLPERAQRLRLRAMLADVRATWLLSRGPLLIDLTFDWMEKFSDQSPDWTDAYLTVLSQIERRARVWTYDDEFRTIWRRPDGSMIPLAVRD